MIIIIIRLSTHPRLFIHQTFVSTEAVCREHYLHKDDITIQFSTWLTVRLVVICQVTYTFQSDEMQYSNSTDLVPEYPPFEPVVNRMGFLTRGTCPQIHYYRRFLVKQAQFGRNWLAGSNSTRLLQTSLLWACDDCPRTLSSNGR